MHPVVLLLAFLTLVVVLMVIAVALVQMVQEQLLVWVLA